MHLPRFNPFALGLISVMAIVVALLASKPVATAVALLASKPEGCRLVASVQARSVKGYNLATALALVEVEVR